jgi:hypothetical protein
MIPSSQYLERNVKKVIGGCTVGKKGNRNPPRPQKHTNKSSDAIVLGFRCAFSRSSLDDDRTKLHPILFPPPTPITHPPSRFQFNFDTFKNSENNNQNKCGHGNNNVCIVLRWQAEKVDALVLALRLPWSGNNEINVPSPRQKIDPRRPRTQRYTSRYVS